MNARDPERLAPALRRTRRTAPSRAPGKRLQTLARSLLLILAFIVFNLPAAPLRAQGGDLRGGEMNPFPKDDVYQVHFIGDWWMDGLKSNLADSLKSLPRLRLNDEVIELRSLRRSSWSDDIATLKSRAASSQMDVAIVMFGASEIGSVFTPERHRFGTDEWTRIYAARIDRVMKTLKTHNGGVYWIGLPIVRRADHSEGYRLINTLLRERAYLNGINFIDTYTRFQDENGAFNRYGPDLAGTIKLLRTKDGVYFTATGYDKIAQLVMQMIRRDLAAAKAQRVVNLAGSEDELAIVRAQSRPDQSQPRQAARKPTAKTEKNPVASPTIYGRLQGGGLPADDTALEIDANVAGRPVRLRLDLPRPALSAAVMSLVTRNQSKDKPARFGDSAVEVAPGGVPLLSTITPADQSALALRKRNLSPTQSTFFKVWGKGERLQPRPGRADDFSWPRPEPEPVVHVTAKPAEQRIQRSSPPRDPNLPPLPLRNPFR